MRFMRGQVGDRGSRTIISGAAGILILALLAAPGCFTYSSYQSARIVERGQPQATFALSRSTIAEAGNDEGTTWYVLEACLRSGLANRVDGSLMLSIFTDVPESWGASVVTADLRVGIIENYLAMALPVSITIGDSYLASLRVQPGLVGTLPIGDKFEINGAVRAHVFARIPDLFAVGYNIGLGIKSASGNWVVRPELGWLVFKENEGAAVRGTTYAQYGIAIEFRSPHRKTEKEPGS